MNNNITFLSNTPVVKLIEKSPKGHTITTLYIYYHVNKKRYHLIGKKYNECYFKYKFDSKKMLQKFVELTLDNDYDCSITLHNYMLFRDFKDLTFDFLEEQNKENELAGYDKVEKLLFKNKRHFKNFIKLAKKIAKSTK